MRCNLDHRGELCFMFINMAPCLAFSLFESLEALGSVLELLIFVGKVVLPNKNQ
jgi:hypothetical protein